jgi:CRISPR-associated protein Cas1
MSWRSVMITRPSRLRLKDRALVVEQDDGCVTIPLEDMAVLLIENQQVSLSAMLLSACAEQQIAVITVNESHHPNGVLLSHLPHSRALQVIRRQMGLSQPRKKRLWQSIVKQKITNQGAVLQQHGHEKTSHRLLQLSRDVCSGDSNNAEGQASQLYFPALLGPGFTRKQSSFHNAALNYGYTIIRAAIARNLVAYGFLTALGLHHRSEQNSFNLADDLIEPFRPLLDHYVLSRFPKEESEGLLQPDHKSALVNILHQDITLPDGQGRPDRNTLLAATEITVISLSRAVADKKSTLQLPLFTPD